MKIIAESLEIAQSLLPKAKNNRDSKNKFFHFAFGYHNKKLLGIGQNNPDKTHTQALRLHNKFGIKTAYPYFHAETDLISKLWNKYYIDDRLSIVVIRLNKHGKLRTSKPCKRCGKILSSLGIEKIIWSINDGFSK